MKKDKNFITSKELLSDELNRLREGRTRKAVENCAKWLAYCLEIGWDKSEIDFLEKIWWENRDNDGN